MHNSLRHYSPIVIAVLLGVLLLFVPLLGNFHFESASLAALVGCFWGGISACRYQKRSGDFNRALHIAGYLYLVGSPLLACDLLLGCFSVDGLAFWILFPLPSIFLGYSLGRLLRSWGVAYARTITVLILLFIAIGIFLYELLTYPQVYFFNHVWGGWPGPIYDETVHINSSTLFFRTLTLLWAALLWHIPLMGYDRFSKWIIGFAAIAIGLGYTHLAEWGVISPRTHIQNVLGGHKSTEHFDMYYDNRLYSEREINLLAREHEFYYSQIVDTLALSGSEKSDKIESYLYGHPWQKKNMVGAKYTSYVPIWLEQDQLHIAKQQLGSSLRHELVHVIAKRFGNNIFNGSWSIGLVEGLAVALDGGSSRTSTLDQIVVSEKPYPTAEELAGAFSFGGFYGGRSAVNYITSGSFVEYLIRNYAVSSFKEAYKTGNLPAAYQKSWQELTDRWHGHLDSIKVDSVDQRTARRIFSIPSLFEQKCPHVISKFSSYWDRYQYHMADHDTVRALVYLDRAVAAADSLPPVKAEWSFRHLVEDRPGVVQRAAALEDTTVELQLLYADAFAMTDNDKRASAHLKRGRQLFAQNPDSVLAPALASRLDDEQWQIYRRMTYQDLLPDSSVFDRAYYRTKIRSLRKAVDRGRRNMVLEYARQLSTLPFHKRYFDDYLQAIHYLAFWGYDDPAMNMIEQLSLMPLRRKYRQRLDQERQWLKFIQLNNK